MEQERKAILFQDIRDSTMLLFGEQEPPHLTMLLSSYYMALAGAVEMAGFRRREYSMKTIGDGAMIALPLRHSAIQTLARILILIRAFQAYIPNLINSS